MCVKAFTDEMELKNYADSMAFCRTLGGVLAPMESADEQTLILKLMEDVKPKKGGAMWLGGRKGSDRIFYWEIDGRQVMLGNWNSGEPNG